MQYAVAFWITSQAVLLQMQIKVLWHLGRVWMGKICSVGAAHEEEWKLGRVSK